MTGSARKLAEEFDGNQSFSVLVRLPREPGCVLDCTYRSEGIGGLPVLYSRPVDEATYLTHTEFYSSTGSRQADAYLQHVQVDGTGEGFLELAFLHLVGDQFYLHSLIAVDATDLVSYNCGVMF